VRVLGIAVLNPAYGTCIGIPLLAPASACSLGLRDHSKRRDMVSRVDQPIFPYENHH